MSGRDRLGDQFIQMKCEGAPGSAVRMRSELIDWWHANHLGDFQAGTGISVSHPYPNIPGAKCDMVFNTSLFHGPRPEWAVELKVIRFIGDNGKKKSYGAGKFLSPYKMETSLTTDLARLHNEAPRVSWRPGYLVPAPVGTGS